MNYTHIFKLKFDTIDDLEKTRVKLKRHLGIAIPDEKQPKIINRLFSEGIQINDYFVSKVLTTITLYVRTEHQKPYKILSECFSEMNVKNVVDVTMIYTKKRG